MTPRGQQRAFYYCDFFCDLFCQILSSQFFTRSLEGARTAGLRTKARRTRVVEAGERARVVAVWERAHETETGSKA
jgi:hypothetical protein